MQSNTHVFILALLALAAGACGSDSTHNLGDVGVTGESLSDYAGDWDGYAEAYDFSDGSDRVRVVLDEDGAGYLEVGDADGPPDRAALLGDPLDALPVHYNGSLYPGFRYPIDGALVEDRRIRFNAHPADAFAAFCAELAPIEDAYNPGLYACVPNGMTHAGEDGCFVDGEPLDCALLSCRDVCECDADGCAPLDLGEVRFDGALSSEGAELEGTLDLGERLTVRLDR